MVVSASGTGHRMTPPVASAAPPADTDCVSDYLLSVLFGVIEGLTEFLPVSSTAHLRLAKEPLGLLDDPFWKMYDVVIQLGAILAVVVFFRVKLLGFLKTFPRGADGDKSVLTHPLSLVMLAFVVTAVPILAGLDDLIRPTSRRCRSWARRCSSAA